MDLRGHDWDVDSHSDGTPSHPTTLLQREFSSSLMHFQQEIISSQVSRSLPRGDPDDLVSQFARSRNVASSGNLWKNGGRAVADKDSDGEDEASPLLKSSRKGRKKERETKEGPALGSIQIGD